MIDLLLANTFGLLFGLACGWLVFRLFKVYKTTGPAFMKPRKIKWFTVGLILICVLTFLTEQNRAPIERRERIEINDPEQLAALGISTSGPKQIRIRREGDVLNWWERPVYNRHLAGMGVSFFLLLLMDARRFSKQDEQRFGEAKPLNIDRSAVLSALQYQLTEERIYRNPNLSLDELAERLQVSKYHLSQLINEELGKNFYSLINERRVQEAMAVLKSTAVQNFTLLALGFEVGFNSKASFYRAFKKQTGMSPADYRKTCVNQC